MPKTLLIVQLRTGKTFVFIGSNYRRPKRLCWLVCLFAVRVAIQAFKPTIANGLNGEPFAVISRGCFLLNENKLFAINAAKPLFQN